MKFTEETALALCTLAEAVHSLGAGQTEPGPIEALSMSINGEGAPGQNCLSDAVVEAGQEIARAIRDAGGDIAEAIRESRE